MKRANDSKPVPDQTELQRQVESLQRDIRRLQLEHDLLKKANELLKKGLGVDLQLLSNREKTLLVDALKQTYALSELFVESPAVPTSIIGPNSGALTSTLMRVLPSPKSSSAINVATGIGECVLHSAGAKCSSRRKSCNV